MSKQAYCPPGKEPDADDTPIGKMMGDMMRKKVNSKMPPKRKEPPPKNDYSQDYVRG